MVHADITPEQPDEVTGGQRRRSCISLLGGKRYFEVPLVLRGAKTRQANTASYAAPVWSIMTTWEVLDARCANQKNATVGSIPPIGERKVGCKCARRLDHHLP